MMKQVAQAMVEKCPPLFRNACLNLMISDNEVADDEPEEEAQTAAAEDAGEEDGGKIKLGSIVDIENPRRYVELLVQEYDLELLKLWVPYFYAADAVTFIGSMQIESYQETASLILARIEDDRDEDEEAADRLITFFKVLDVYSRCMQGDSENAVSQYNECVTALLDSGAEPGDYGMIMMPFLQEAHVQEKFSEVEDTMKRFCETAIDCTDEFSQAAGKNLIASIAKIIPINARAKYDKAYWDRLDAEQGHLSDYFGASLIASLKALDKDNDELVQAFRADLDEDPFTHARFLALGKEKLRIYETICGRHSGQYCELICLLASYARSNTAEARQYSKVAWELTSELYGKDSDEARAALYNMCKAELSNGNANETCLDGLAACCKALTENYGEQSKEVHSAKLQLLLRDWRNMTRRKYVEYLCMEVYQSLDDTDEENDADSDFQDKAIYVLLEAAELLASGFNSSEIATAEWVLGGIDYSLSAGQEARDRAIEIYKEVLSEDDEEDAADEEDGEYTYTQSSDECFVQVNEIASFVYCRPNIPAKKVNKAIGYYAFDADPEDVRLYYDTTVFGSAKEGMLITGDCIYIRGLYEKQPVKLRLVDIANIECGKDEICFVDEDGNRFRQLMVGAQMYFHEFSQAIHALLYELRNN